MKSFAVLGVVVALTSTLIQGHDYDASTAVSSKLSSSAHTVNMSSLKTSSITSKHSRATLMTTKKRAPCSTSITKPSALSTGKVTTKLTTKSTITKKPSSTRTSSTTLASIEPQPTKCTYEQAAPGGIGLVNGQFTEGLKGWKITSNSTRPNVVGVGSDSSDSGGDGKSAFMIFPRGEISTATLSQVVVACARNPENIGFFYRLVRGGDCHLRASLIPLIDFTSTNITVVDDYSPAGSIYEYSEAPKDTAVKTPFSVTVTCDGTSEAVVRLDSFQFGGIGG